MLDNHVPEWGSIDMSPEERERWNDERLAPALLELARECIARGIHFVAFAEYAPGETQRTATLRFSEASAKTRLVYYAANSDGNIDAMLNAVCRDAKRNGHSSVYLKMLDVPCEPEQPTEESDGH